MAKRRAQVRRREPKAEAREAETVAPPGVAPEQRAGKRRPGLLTQAAVVVASIALTLLAAELGLRWKILGGLLPALATFFTDEVSYFGRGRAGGLIGDPELGFRLDPETPGHNPMALRDPASVGPKQPGRPRWLVLGDSISYVIDQGIPAEKGYVNLLRQTLGERAEVINASVPGFTTHQERLWFEKYLQPLQPDLVILQYCLNDNHRFLHRFQPGVGILATEEGRRILLPEKGDPLAWLPRGSYLARRLRLAYSRWKGIGQSPFAWDRDIGFAAGWRDDAWALFEDELTRLKALVEAQGGELIVLVVPLAAQFDPAALAADARYVFKPQHKLLEIAGRLGVRTLDLTPTFAQQGGFTLFVADGIHLNERGHALAAEQLCEFLGVATARAEPDEHSATER